jgi:fumarate hydratase class I
MTMIRADHVIDSVADALQFISYYHPLDFIQAVNAAYEREESQAARDALAQILINSRMSAMGRRPICQDTGIVTVFVKVGMQVRWDDSGMSLSDMINEGVRRAYSRCSEEYRRQYPSCDSLRDRTWEYVGYSGGRERGWV